MTKQVLPISVSDNVLSPKLTTCEVNQNTTCSYAPLNNRSKNTVVKPAGALLQTVSSYNVNIGNNCFSVCSDKDIFVNITENITEQKYIKNVESAGALCAGTINSSNVYTNVVNNVHKLGFDTDSGFDVTDLGSGLAKIAMNSTFKYWEVDGNPGLTACGLDTVNFIAGSGVTITSDNSAVPKSLTINATGGGGSGASGYSGASGFSGYSGEGTSGFSGYSGAGISGVSGYSGVSGAGTSGVSGYSGVSGAGTSGFSGYSGAGTSGVSGYSGVGGPGTSGVSGYSGAGTSGVSGYSGVGGPGTSGVSGYSGAGTSGFSGYSGVGGPGTSGFSGYSGVGTSGFSGYSGVGTSGVSGYSGVAGGVIQLVAGTNVTLSPTNGLGTVTINATGGGGGGSVTSVDTSGTGLGFSISGGPITSTGTITLSVPTASALSNTLQGNGLVSDSVGFRILPQNSQSADYVLVAADSGKHLLHPSSDANARTFTIPANGTVAYPIGTSITFINETTQVLNIGITSDTMYLAGSGLTGSRTLSQYGVATAIKTGTTTWYISGTGLT